MQQGKIEDLFWELTVLSRAVEFKNLSEASGPLRISQPQLSRIVTRIERELAVTLLDRSSKRLSAWTQMAHRIALAYGEQLTMASQRLDAVVRESEPKVLVVGALEGLSIAASGLAIDLLKVDLLQEVHVLVCDLVELEARFLKGEFDLALTCREPGRRKYLRRLELGWQAMIDVRGGDRVRAVSPFERAEIGRRQSQEKLLVSNSLTVRRLAITQGVASGLVPTPLVADKPARGAVPALLLAQEVCTPRIWSLVQSHFENRRNRADNAPERVLRTANYGSTTTSKDSKAKPRSHFRVQKEPSAPRPQDRPRAQQKGSL